jgi:hypothetical protein
MDGLKFLSGHDVALMVIDDFDIEGIGTDPTKANPPLSIDANAVLSDSITRQFFQAIAWWHLKVIEGSCRIKYPELSQCRALKIRRDLA